VSISLESSILAQVFSDDPFVGPRTVTYEIPALPAGDYQFICTVHVDTMRGTLLVAEQ
jgi:plastocyanin